MITDYRLINMRLAEQLLLSAEKNEISGINLFLLTFFQ
jgi:hypothetical protein